MADKKISALTGAATPLAGTEVLPIVQSGATVKVAVNDLTTGKTVNGSNFIASSSFGAGGTTPTAGWNTAVFQTQNASFNSNNGQDLRLYQNLYFDGGNYRYITANPGGLMLQYQNETEWFRSTDGSPSAGGVANFTSVVKFTTTGNVNVSNGNIVIGTAGKGIDFSANTHAPGMTSELLNWYEEGTFTPTFTGFTVGNGTVFGFYRRIGKQVFVTYGFILGSSSSVGSLTGLSGLPFTTGTVGGSRFFNATGVAFKQGVGGFPAYGLLYSASTTGSGPASTNTNLGMNATAPFTWAADDSLSFTATYFVD